MYSFVLYNIFPALIVIISVTLKVILFAELNVIYCERRNDLPRMFTLPPYQISIILSYKRKFNIASGALYFQRTTVTVQYNLLALVSELVVLIVKKIITSLRVIRF